MIVLQVIAILVVCVGVFVFAFRHQIAENLRGTYLDKARSFPKAGSPWSVAAFGGCIALVGVAVLALQIGGQK